MRTSIVLGLGFGDEGKGLTTSYLCSQSENPIVVRFNGGHQAGHTVCYEARKHVFASFGSGTLQGVPTYISKYCTFSPGHFQNELSVLNSKGIEPHIIIDPLCPVTTPFDIESNRGNRENIRHGTVGSGFGTTIKRHDIDNVKLFYQDLFFDSVLEAKLNNIVEYHGMSRANSNILISRFLSSVKSLRGKHAIELTTPDLKGYDHHIFEGAQGILLDMDFGFFPNVTRSNTTCKNALEIIKEHKRFVNHPDIYYVTRAYQTRHGNGFMTNEHIDIPIVNNADETNKQNEWQGAFRIAPLDIDLINYALRCDGNFSVIPDKVQSKNIMVTCNDHFSGPMIPYTDSTAIDYNSNGFFVAPVEAIIANGIKCEFSKVLLSYSQKSNSEIKELQTAR